MDSNHNSVSKNEGVYYREVKKKRNIYFITDFYKTGEKYREGKAEGCKLGAEKFKGIVTYFYQNGNLFKKERYKNGRVFGLYQEFYSTGEVMIDGGYENGLKEGVWKVYYKTGKIKSKGKYHNGEKVGVWKTFYKNVYFPERE